MGGILGSIAGGVLLYALLGQFANLVFATAFTMLKWVFFVNTGQYNADGTAELGVNNALFDFNIFAGGVKDQTSVLGIMRSGTTGDTFLRFIYLASWILFGVVIIFQVVKLIINNKRTESGAWVRLVLRIMIVAGVLSNWYGILNELLKFSGKLIMAPAKTILGNISSITTGFGNSDLELISIGSSLTNLPPDYILSCILAFSLGSSVISCVISFLERYVSLIIYCYISPLAVALAGSEESQDTLKDWLMGLIPQFLGLLAVVAMMSFGFGVIGTYNEGFTNGSLQAQDIVLKCAVATVFFSQARNVEEFFNMIGFKTMRATDAARSALAGVGTMMSIKNVAQPLANAAGSGLVKASTAEGRKEIAQGFKDMADSAKSNVQSLNNNNKLNNNGAGVDAMKNKAEKYGEAQNNLKEAEARKEAILKSKDTDADKVAATAEIDRKISGYEQDMENNKMSGAEFKQNYLPQTNDNEEIQRFKNNIDDNAEVIPYMNNNNEVKGVIARGKDGNWEKVSFAPESEKRGETMHFTDGNGQGRAFTTSGNFSGRENIDNSRMTEYSNLRPISIANDLPEPESGPKPPPVPGGDGGDDHDPPGGGGDDDDHNPPGGEGGGDIPPQRPPIDTYNGADGSPKLDPTDREVSDTRRVNTGEDFKSKFEKRLGPDVAEKISDAEKVYPYYNDKGEFQGNIVPLRNKEVSSRVNLRE